jgi:hypothetical protein
MAGKKIGGGHLSATFALDESQAQGTVAASDGNSRRSSGEYFAWSSGGVIERIGFPDFEQSGLVLTR